MNSAAVADVLFEIVHALRAPLRALDGFTVAIREEASASLSSECQRYLDRIAHNARELQRVGEGLTRLAQALSPPQQKESVELQSVVSMLATDNDAWLERVQIQVDPPEIKIDGWDSRHVRLLLQSLKEYAANLELPAPTRVLELSGFPHQSKAGIEVRIQPRDAERGGTPFHQPGWLAIETGIVRALLSHYPPARLEIHSADHLEIVFRSIQEGPEPLLREISPRVGDALDPATARSVSFSSPLTVSNQKRIFFVDDEPAEWELFQLAVEDTGLERGLEWYRDSRAALETLRELADRGATLSHGLPAAVFVDLRMPLLDGVSFVRKMRQVPALVHIPVVMLSSSNNPGDIHAAYSAGANAFVTKPTEFRHYAECLYLALAFWARCNEVA